MRGHGGRYLEVGIESTFCQGPLSCFSDSLLLDTIHSCTKPTDICIAQEVLSDESLGTSQAFPFRVGSNPEVPPPSEGDYIRRRNCLRTAPLNSHCHRDINLATAPQSRFDCMVLHAASLHFATHLLYLS